jgi:multicomponent K+:H+ antiporter subunit D
VSTWIEHLVIVPVVLPLAAGALMLLVDERRHALKAGIGLASLALLLAAAGALVARADAAVTQV